MMSSQLVSGWPMAVKVPTYDLIFRMCSIMGLLPFFIEDKLTLKLITLALDYTENILSSAFICHKIK